MIGNGRRVKKMDGIRRKRGREAYQSGKTSMICYHQLISHNTPIGFSPWINAYNK
jgi:hypothetical protein